MQLHTCLARTTDDLNVPCSSRASPPLSFCRQHYEECCALKEIERSAALEAERLEGIVDKMIEEGAGAYTKVRDVRKDAAVVRLLLEAFKRYSEAREVLKTQFSISTEHRWRDGEDMKEKQDRLVAFIVQLEDRERVLTAEQDAVKAREVLMLPHPPFTACPSSPSTAAPSAVNRQCPTIKLTSRQCASSPMPRHRLCPLHLATHTITLSVLRLETEVLEKARVEVVRIEVGKGDVSSNIAIVRDYVRHLEEAMDSRKRHQKTYSCDAPEEHTALLDDWSRRLTSAVLLLGELKGRKDSIVTAIRQGQAEHWATEYLGEIKRAEEAANNELAGRLTVGAAMGAGLTVLLGGPWAVGALVGATVLGGIRSRKDEST
ncbi:hypothetical protein C8Q76DRAFT_266597 [Earliella scabrosa]|nr:hypothetical protein C8Q76DRAFT_266597 [Earliella scabrosa]